MLLKLFTFEKNSSYYTKNSYLTSTQIQKRIQDWVKTFKMELSSKAVNIIKLLPIFVKARSQMFSGSPKMHLWYFFEIQHIKMSDREKLVNESACFSHSFITGLINFAETLNITYIF